jgi:hypothetical protein
MWRLGIHLIGLCESAECGVSSNCVSNDMRKYFFPIFIVVLMATAAESFGANYYVRKGATGTNKGTDWTNAWNEMNQIKFSTVACGDTIWIAGGSYTTSLNANKSCTAGNVLTLNRVQATDSAPVAAAGWNASYDSLVVLPNIDIPGPAAYITINGRIAYGIQVLINGTGGDGIDGGEGSGNGQPIDHITWSYIEVYGPACVSSASCSGGVVGVNIMPYCGGANRTNMLFDHMSVHRTGEAFRGCGWDSSTIQYSLIYDTHNDGQQHEDLLYSNPPYQNVTWRYNKIFMSPNDGIFFEGGTGAANWAFYGNVVYHSGGALITFKPGSNYGPVYIYNNVFENDGTFGDYQPGWLYFADTMLGGEVANNVFENISNTGPPPNANHNAYSINGASDGGTGSFNYGPGTLGASTMFVNESPSNPIAADFHLTSTGVTTFAPGKALPAPYNMDPDGNVRGAGGNWTIGAYQAPGASPAPPTNLNGVVH